MKLQLVLLILRHIGGYRLHNNKQEKTRRCNQCFSSFIVMSLLVASTSQQTYQHLFVRAYSATPFLNSKPLARNIFYVPRLKNKHGMKLLSNYWMICRLRDRYFGRTPQFVCNVKAFPESPTSLFSETYSDGPSLDNNKTSEVKAIIDLEESKSIIDLQGGIVQNGTINNVKEKIIVYDERNWKEHPNLNPTIHFRSWLIPVAGKSIQKVLSSKLTQPYLASNLDIVQNLHQRLKLVRDVPYSHNKSIRAPCKLILLHPDTPKIQQLPVTVQELLGESEEGPVIPITFSAKQFTASYILAHLLPESVHPVPTAFETIGHIAHLNLKPHHISYGPLIGNVLLETLPSIETVIHKVGDVSGPYRTYSIQILAGKSDTTVQVTESGVNLQFDLKDVYWCSRLSEERQRLLAVEVRHKSTIADVFCGVGALCLQAAKHLNCTIWANDWNPHAIESLKQNVIKNGVNTNFERIHCGDAYDFLVDLGLKDSSNNNIDRDHRLGLPDHVILNYPLEAPTFLGALRWWPVNNDQKDFHMSPRVHVYTFARADEGSNRSAEDVAIDLVANNLLPTSNPIINRKAELNEEYSCRVLVHPVRDVAPGKLVMCVSFSATPKLLRYMQGDFR